MWASLLTATPAVVLVATVQGLVLRFVASPVVRHWTGGLTLAVVALAGVLQLYAVSTDVRESGTSAFPTPLMAVLVAVSWVLTALSVYLGVRLVRG
jgi:chromate transport protein ChrA